MDHITLCTDDEESRDVHSSRLWTLDLVLRTPSRHPVIHLASTKVELEATAK